MRLSRLQTAVFLFCAAWVLPAQDPSQRASTAASATADPLAAPISTPGPAVPTSGAYVPIQGAERMQWYLRNTGGAAIGGSIMSAGWATAWGTPREYAATWEGFGKRYALSISGVALANGAEAGLGALWGEDPRYVRKGGTQSYDFGSRLRHVLLSTVTATNRQGERMPAYARFIAIPGSSILQNQWRPESQSSGKEALLRTLYGFLGRMSANAIREFLPDWRRRNRVPQDVSPYAAPTPSTSSIP